METLKVRNPEAEKRMRVTKGGRVWEIGQLWSRSTKLDLCRMNKSRYLTYRMMTRVNNSVLSTGNAVAR